MNKAAVVIGALLGATGLVLALRSRAAAATPSPSGGGGGAQDLPLQYGPINMLVTTASPGPGWAVAIVKSIVVTNPNSVPVSTTLTLAYTWQDDLGTTGQKPYATVNVTIPPGGIYTFAYDGQKENNYIGGGLKLWFYLYDTLGGESNKIGPWYNTGTGSINKLF